MENKEPNTPPTIEKKTLPPPGVIRRNVQAWVIIGIALLMTIIIAFSNHNAPPPKRPPESPATTVSDSNQARIKEYRDRIEQQAMRLKDEQDQIVKAKAAVAVADMPESAAPYAAAGSYGRSSAYSSAPVEKSWIEQEREKRNYQSLFSSNIALSTRGSRESDGRRDTLPSISQAFAKAKQPSENDEDSLGSRSKDTKIVDEKKKGHEEITSAVGIKYRLYEGTVLETVLTNRLDGVFSGPVNCMVTTDIYSHNGQHLLIPAGTRALGEVKRVDALGQERLATTFHRLVLPDGFTVSLDTFRGLNQIGETGLRDQVNHHYLQVFGVSIAIGAIGGLSQSQSRYGTDASPADVYRQGVAASLSQSSLRILDRFLSVLPTVTIREGQRVKFYLADDLLLPAYDNHRMPNEI